MSLRWYRRPKLVVLHPETPLLEAARAMENTEVGAILVQDAGDLVGIVTDRDVAVRATGQGLDPRMTPLSAVMSEGLATLSIDDGLDDAVGLMMSRNVRRIPLLEDGRIAGMVTLDDLLLDEAASLEDVSSVVVAQLGVGGPAPSPRNPAARRSAARAEATYRRMIGEMQWAAELPSFEQAEAATEVIVSGLLRRLVFGEARDLLSQLPSLLRQKLEGLPPGPDTGVSLATIASDLANRLDIDEERAGDLVEIIGAQVLGFVSEGQARKVRSQLPPDLRDALEVTGAPSA
ncbi:MAG TPA: CBS domain-containing protein [Vulgatibacter sp.]